LPGNAPAREGSPAAKCTRAVDRCARASYPRADEQPETDPQGRVPRRRARHALPAATKAIPKELLPIVDRPLIQYAVDEAREAGIEQMIFVTGRGKTALVEHFDMAYELETTMGERGKDLSILDPTRFTPGNLITVRQQVPLGLGHAIWCARAIVGDEPFAILLPDELMVGKPGCMAQMVAAYNEVGGNLISVLEVPHRKCRATA
jgi:UTP--glucose-1-phosphate uridylyltransferase